MSIISANTRAWLHGLFAVSISAFATSASGIIMLPTVFNFTHNGLLNMVKVAGAPALFSAFTYLKASPLPPTLGPGDTLKVTNPTISATGTITADSATLQKAPETPEVK
jgi:hypothetical protein